MRPISAKPTTPFAGGAMFSCADLCHLPLLLILLLLACYALCSVAAAACDPFDRATLASFLSKVSLLPSASPLNWNDNFDCCGWEGVFCDAPIVRVLGLSLPGASIWTPTSSLLRSSIAPKQHESEQMRDDGNLSWNPRTSTTERRIGLVMEADLEPGLAWMVMATEEGGMGRRQEEKLSADLR